MSDKQDLFDKAAYGGKGWSPRITHLRDEMGSVWGAGGLCTEWSALKSVLLHKPGPELGASTDPNAVQMLDKIDADLAGVQHDKLAQAYQEVGVLVHFVAFQLPFLFF